VYEFRQNKTALEAQDREYLKCGVLALDKDLNVEERVNRLASIFGSAIDVIENRRLQRLRDRPVNHAKLNEIRRRVEEAILAGNGGIDVFRDFTVTRDRGDLEKRELHAPQVEKGYLTEPVMAQEPLNLWDVVVRSVQSRAAGYVWRDFVQRPRRSVVTPDEASYRTVLFEEAKRLIASGQQPVLLVHRGHEPAWIREWFGWGEQRPEGIDLVRKKGMGTNLYAGTVNDIDVYRLELDPGKSLLFRADLLRRVKYGADNEGRVVQVAFDSDQKKGLVFRFSQGTEWLDDNVLELVYPVAASESAAVE
jgi:hypothetical protein